jgi:hypothetical protein
MGVANFQRLPISQYPGAFLERCSRVMRRGLVYSSCLGGSSRTIRGMTHPAVYALVPASCVEYAKELHLVYMGVAMSSQTVLAFDIIFFAKAAPET